MSKMYYSISAFSYLKIIKIKMVPEKLKIFLPISAVKIPYAYLNIVWKLELISNKFNITTVY